jgi:hypothetical protein
MFSLNQKEHQVFSTNVVIDFDKRKSIQKAFLKERKDPTSSDIDFKFGEPIQQSSQESFGFVDLQKMRVKDAANYEMYLKQFENDADKPAKRKKVAGTGYTTKPKKWRSFRGRKRK